MVHHFSAITSSAWSIVFGIPSLLRLNGHDQIMTRSRCLILLNSTKLRDPAQPVVSPAQIWPAEAARKDNEWLCIESRHTNWAG